jgi:hypothetical protein
MFKYDVTMLFDQRFSGSNEWDEKKSLYNKVEQKKKRITYPHFTDFTIATNW